MISSVLKKFITDSIIVGNNELADRNKALLFKRGFSNIFELLDFDNDEAFLDPLLFTYLNRNIEQNNTSITIEQIIYGYIEKQKRPKKIEAYTDKNGILYLPKIGYFKTNIFSCLLNVETNPKSQEIELLRDDKRVLFEFIPPIYSYDSNMEIYQFTPPNSSSFYKNRDKKIVDIEVENITKLHHQKLLEALEFIKINYDYYYNWLIHVMKRFLILENDEIWSFANVAAYGTSFISSNKDKSLVFFIEDIIHQCSHNIFYTVTFLHRKEFLAVDPHSELKTFTKNINERRSVYGAFHGLFTQANINVFIDICLDKNLFNGEERHELLGRQSDDMKRWKKSLNDLAHPKIFTEKGKLVYEELKSIYDKLYEKRANEIEKFDTSNQPYIFNYKKFKELNPLN